MGVGHCEPNQGRYCIVNHGRSVRLQTDFGLSVSFDGQTRAEIQVPSSYSNKIQGICADFDGNGSNDYVTRDGEDVRNKKHRYSLIGNSWKIDDPKVPE